MRDAFVLVFYVVVVAILMFWSAGGFERMKEYGGFRQFARKFLSDTWHLIRVLLTKGD